MKYNIEELKSKLKKSMTFDNVVNERYYHSLAVSKKALELNECLHLNLDKEKVEVSGLLHDCAKFVSFEESINLLKLNNDPIVNEDLHEAKKVVHSFTGKYYVQTQYQVDDEEIKNAIYYHTTGKANMSTLEELIFVSDFIDETRVGSYVIKPRELAEKSLNKACAYILKITVENLQELGRKIHPLTLEAYEYYKQYE